MLRSMKLSHQKNTGKLKEHRSTSFLPLLILVIAAAFPLSIATVSAQSWTRPGPAAESNSLTGVMPGEPPTEAAVIRQPVDLGRFSTSPVTISGSCPAGTIVQIYKNDIFAGSTVCTSNGSFTVEIDLLIGENTIVAKVYDALSQEGPSSQTILVYYDALPPQSTSLAPLNFGGAQMLLNTDTVFRGIFPNKDLSVPVSIVGGRAPYAVNVFWGDTTNDVLVRNDASVFTLKHAYKRAGTYQLNVQATDADGRVAFLSVAVIVNGADTAAVGATGSSSTSNPFNIVYALWPVYVAISAIVGGFWLGEVREKRVLRKQGLLLNPPTPPRA